jgi:hypothetical protein
VRSGLLRCSKHRISLNTCGAKWAIFQENLYKKMPTLRRRYSGFDANTRVTERNQSNFRNSKGRFSMKKVFLSALMFVALASGAPAYAQSKGELLWLGQAAFKITTLSGKVIVIDAWLRANPIAKRTLPQFEAAMKAGDELELP